jgi:hypothetical protein
MNLFFLAETFLVYRYNIMKKLKQTSIVHDFSYNYNHDLKKTNHIY